MEEQTGLVRPPVPRVHDVILRLNSYNDKKIIEYLFIFINFNSEASARTR